MDLKEQMYLQNPWWRDTLFLPLESRLPKRTLFSSFFEDVTTTRQAISLTGLRRVGKSTLLKQIIAKLLSGSVKPKYLLYFSFDQPTVLETTQTLESIMSIYFDSILGKKIHRLTSSVYVFFDEIQLIPYWQDILKRYYDLTPHIKFVVSGSASLFVQNRSKESLAGRLFERYLPPLTFSEYRLLSQNRDMTDFLSFGQFPEMLALPNLERKMEYLKEGVIGKVLEIDIVKTYGVRKTVDFERLFWSLLPNCGQIIASMKLMHDLQLKKATLFKYLGILEKSLLINKVLNMSGSFRSETRLLRKLYPGSSNFLSLNVAPVGIGFKAECYVASILKSRFKNVYLFHHRGREVDFVVPDKKLAIEVKYQEKIHQSDYWTLEKLVRDKDYLGIVITKNQEQKPKGKPIRFIPLENLDTALP